MPKAFSRFAALAALAAVALMPAATLSEEGPQMPVVVELFTSQGCSSCPPADAVLGELARQDDLVALAFHVDYWDYIGWKDPFATPEMTQRQRDYRAALNLRTMYTPQMVIDGRIDVVGSHRREVKQAIATAAEAPKLPVTIAKDAAGRYRVSLPDAAVDPAGPASVWLVYFDRQHVTPVKRGENAGATLTNYNVVRRLERIGAWNGAAVEFPIDALDAVDGDDRGCAVIVQADGMGPVLGAAIMKLDAGGS